MRKRSAESKCSEGNTSSTNVVHTESADGFGVAKQVGADLSVQRVDCGTQTDNAPTSTVAASLPEFTTIEAILGRSRATQTFPHARTVFTRSTQFQAPIRPTDQPSTAAQTETTGSVAGMAVPFNHITLSGDRRGDGGAGRFHGPPRGAGVFGGAAQRIHRPARRVNFMVAAENNNNANNSYHNTNNSINNGVNNIERFEAARNLAEDVVVMEGLTALLEERLNFAALQAKATTMAKQASWVNAKSLTQGLSLSHLLPRTGQRNAAMRQSERSDVATSTNIPLLAGGTVPGFRFNPRRGLELGTNPLYVSDPPHSSNFNLETNGLGKAIVRIIPPLSDRPSGSVFIPKLSPSLTKLPTVQISNTAVTPAAPTSTRGSIFPTPKVESRPSLLSMLMPGLVPPNNFSRQSAESAKMDVLVPMAKFAASTCPNRSSMTGTSTVPLPSTIPGKSSAVTVVAARAPGIPSAERVEPPRNTTAANNGHMKQ